MKVTEFVVPGIENDNSPLGPSFDKGGEKDLTHGSSFA